MTKVFVHASTFEYHQTMTELVRQIRMQKIICGVKPPIPIEHNWYLPAIESYGANLLNPPIIEALFLYEYEGHIDDLVGVQTSDDLGIVSVYVSIRDDKGNIIENGYATEEPIGLGIWFYVASVSISSGTPVIVYFTVEDCLGGVAAKSESITIP
jgi:hypothetical protein